MSVDLRKNQDSLIKAYKEVVDDKSATNWALFGYEGLSPVLKVVSQGDGGIEEMSDDLNSGKIMYAYCRILDPNTNLPKYVLINWQGEGCQEGFKLKCTTHLSDLTNFFKTIHVTVNARTEADVNEDDIMQKVAKSSGANYSFHKEKAKPVEAPAPVGSNYQRTHPEREVKAQSRDAFWAQAEKDETLRREEEAKRAAEEMSKMEEERKAREVQEAKERDKRLKERMKAVHEQRSLEKQASSVDKDSVKKQWEQEQVATARDEEERRQRSEAARKKRAMEAQNLVSGSGTSGARAFFKQKSVEMPDSGGPSRPSAPGKLKSPFLSGGQEPEEPPAPRQPISLPREEPPAPPPSRGAAPPPSRGAAPPPRQPSPPPREPSPPRPAAAAPVPSKPPRAAEPESEPKSQPHVRNLLSESLPPRQDSDQEDEDQEWNEEEDQGYQQEPAYHQEPPAHAPAEDYVAEEPPEDEQTPVSNGQGVCAKALYDYEASDESEISFDPGDIITDIEQVDAGWWTGYNPSGHHGMFPANYVELL